MKMWLRACFLTLTSKELNNSLHRKHFLFVCQNDIAVTTWRCHGCRLDNLRNAIKSISLYHSGLWQRYAYMDPNSSMFLGSKFLAS